MGEARWWALRHILAALGKCACRHNAGVEAIRAKYGMSYEQIFVQILLAA